MGTDPIESAKKLKNLPRADAAYSSLMMNSEETTNMQMEFALKDALPVLSGTPAVLNAMLSGLPETWIHASEGDGTWSPFDVVGHLIHAERTNWMMRARHILSGSADPFKKFDRSDFFADSKGQTLANLLRTFETIRARNVSELKGLNLSKADCHKPGLHPDLGTVTLEQLLASWVVHDLDHTAQIVRVMAQSYATAVGPWATFLRSAKSAMMG
jgi:hypothetical protein